MSISVVQLSVIPKVTTSSLSTESVSTKDLMAAFTFSFIVRSVFKFFNEMKDSKYALLLE